MRLIHHAWALVNPTTIRRCFVHCGFSSPSTVSTVPNDDVDPEDMPEATIAKLTHSGYELNMNQYIAAHDDLESSDPLTDDTIISLVQQPNKTQEVKAIMKMMMLL